MSNLRELQESFQHYILKNDNLIEAEISDHRLPAKHCLEVYQEGYYLRLLEVLEKEFLSLKKLIGSEKFEKIGQAYINAYPSNHFSVAQFGRYFSKFLTTYSAAEPFYAEIAAFEWIISKTLEAPDANQLVVEDMTKFPPESWPNMQFQLHPSVQLLTFHYNAPEVWGATNNDEEEYPEIKQNPQPVVWMVWYFSLLSYYEPLNEKQMWMIQAIKEEKTFSEICEGLCEWLSEEEVAQFAAGSLRHWVEMGVFSNINVKNMTTDVLQEANIELPTS